jgi:methylmalonyl-CoA/ethylmalonyl-CoA epimerase
VRDPLFTETLQISIVVPDLDAAVRVYADEYGIGPWAIYEFNPETVRDMRERGEAVQRRWRLALATVGGVQWELVQPLDPDSVYARFLAEHGPGVHHVGVGVRDYAAATAELAARGHDVLLGGEYKGVTFSYHSTDRDLGVIAELFDRPPGVEHVPDATYPPRA